MVLFADMATSMLMIFFFQIYCALPKLINENSKNRKDSIRFIKDLQWTKVSLYI